MGRLIKWLFYLLILGLLVLIAYVYIGPYFGADFGPAQDEIRVPVQLDGN